jgi:hypothetical protein
MTEASMNVEQLKSTMLGTWVSIAPEIRPSKNPDGTLKPFYLRRSFVYQHEDRFELTVMNYADPTAKIAIAKIEIAGHMFWRGDHPIAPGAQKVDFVADEAYAVTPLVQPFADLLNKVSRVAMRDGRSAESRTSSERRSRPLAWPKGRISRSTTSCICGESCSSGAHGTSTVAASIRKRIGPRTCRSR